MGSQKDFSGEVATSGEISFYPLEIKKTTYLLKTSYKNAKPPLPTPIVQG